MSDELKACPFCGKFMYYEESASGIDAHCTNKNCLMYNKEWLWLDVAKWNTRPLEDALRAELAASQAEVERLRGIIRRVEWSVVVIGATWGDGYRRCPICQNSQAEDHEPECPFYQWEAK